MFGSYKRPPTYPIKNYFGDSDLDFSQAVSTQFRLGAHPLIILVGGAHAVGARNAVPLQPPHSQIRE